MNESASKIANDARRLAPRERESFLSSTCVGDDALLKEVLALLASDQTMDVGSDKTIVDSTSRHKNRVPEQIGQFHVRREIGVGGMGAVYEALQENPRRRVAIKVLKASVASEAARKRFEYESQVLARLKHPGIAKIYEAGTYDDGSGPMPYFAMEYIAGRKQIDTYSQEKELDRNAKLRLFTQVCEALHHGHQKGIIHRDLKPGNILVDTEGRPRVIDFGVARATDSDVALATMQTEVGEIIGTIEYMSPEQCEGEPDLIDVRSDIYSLGVILFELLTGERPRKLDSSSIYEAIKTIRESAPTRMGTLDRSLRGDLETIAGKALEKDPDRRYQSALEFKQDIERFLANEPIDARPPSLVYQTKMFAKRHKGAAASIVVVALVLVTTTGWSLIERGRASRAAEAAIAAEAQAQLAAEQARSAEAQATEDRDAALAAEAETAKALERVEAEKSRTLQAMEFVTGIFQLANPAKAQGRKLGTLEIFREASAQIPDVFADEPAMAAELYATLGGIQLEFGDVEFAEPNLVKAVVLAEREHGTASLEALSAGVLLAAVMVDQGRYDEASSRLEAIRAATRIIGEDALAIDLVARRWVLEIMGSQLRMGEAMELAQGMVADARKIHGPDHEKTVTYEVELASYMLTTMRVSGQQIPEDFELPYGNLERVRSIVGDLHPVTIKTRCSEAMLLLPGTQSASQTGLGGKEIGELIDGIVADSRLVLGNTHSRTLEVLYIQGLGQLMGGDADTAMATLTEAYDGFVENHSAEHPMAHQIAVMLGSTYLNLDRVEEAVPLLKVTWDGQKKRWGESDIRTLTAESTYAIALMMLDRFDEAHDVFEHALEGHDLFPVAMMSESRFKMHYVKAVTLVKFGHIPEAMAAAERLIGVAEALTEAETRLRWAYPFEMVQLFLEDGQVDQAIRLAQRSMPFIRDLLADDPDTDLKVQIGLGRLFLREEAADAASMILEEAIELVDQEGVEEANSARVLVLAGLARARTNRAEEGIPLIEDGLSRVSGVAAQLAARQALAEAMANVGRADEARELALAILPGLVGMWEGMEDETDWTLRWLLSEEAGLDDSELLGVAEWATSQADPEQKIQWAAWVINTVPQQRIEAVLLALETALTKANAELEETSHEYTSAWFVVHGWKAHFLYEAGEVEAARELAGRLAAQQWVILAQDDSDERAVFVEAADRLLELLETILGPEDHRVLANRGQLATARGQKTSAAAFLEAAREQADDPVQKAFYLELITSLRE